jgi:hypothetical protein
MNPDGRPTVYRPDCCEQAHKYCLLGATNEDLGLLFGVTRRTVDNWLAIHPDFARAVESGRLAADAKVAGGLFARATGFERKVKRTALYRGEPKACIFWLRNRRRATWSDAGHDAAADPSDDAVDDVALLEAAGERMRHRDGD